MSVLALVGAAAVGDLTFIALFSALSLLAMDCVSYVRPAPDHLPAPRTEEDYRRILRVGSLPATRDTDAAIRVRLEQQRERVRTLARWTRGLALGMGAVACVVASVEGRPGYLLVAFGWVVIARWERWRNDDALERYDDLEAELDRRWPSGVGHG